MINFLIIFHRYLTRLAVTDFLYLFFNIPFCLEVFIRVSKGHIVSDISAIYYAHIAVPMVNMFLTISVYIVVWLSYDRFLAVCKPQKFSIFQRVEVVHSRCILSVILTFVVYTPSSLRESLECNIEGCCVFNSKLLHTQWYIYYELFREIYSRLFPSILITFFNLAIIKHLRQTNHTRCTEPSNLWQEGRLERERKLVLLLLSMTVLFYISSVPSAIYKIIPQENWRFLPYFRAVADVLEVSGHVFNFVLYFLFSPEFRKTLKSLLFQTESRQRCQNLTLDELNNR